MRCTFTKLITGYGPAVHVRLKEGVALLRLIIWLALYNQSAVIYHQDGARGTG
jgi:hypothetical protein